MYQYLDKIHSTKDLKNLHLEELPKLCAEIRDFLIQHLSKTGGHLAPNLGVVELTVALHYIFNSPDDKIIFDVGHQCYVHKILTGRKDQFYTLRKKNGLSGFPKTYESPHDIFNTGHSSTSISSALGIATANKLSGNPCYTIAVIGDGALTGGLAFEGLNNLNSKDLNLIIVLNDNQMSISPSVGGLSLYLNKIRSAAIYTSSKNGLKKFLEKIPILGKLLYTIIRYLKKGIKHILFPSSILFEQFGLSYLGPIDGNNVEEVTDLLENAKNINKPVLLHVVTRKGKGYIPAEKEPDKFHSIGQFEIETGKPIAKSSASFSSEFGAILTKEAAKNEKIVAITAAMADGVGLTAFREQFKDRFFDVGIAEEHAVTFASGLAKQGFIPVVAIYSTFLQRSYDEIIHDVALQNLHVIFCIDRAGLVGADGETHHGLFDLAYLSTIPNMTLCAPKDGLELEAMLKFAFKHQGPIAIRYPKDAYCKDLLPKQKRTPIELGKAEILKEGTDITIIAYGKMVSRALEVVEILKKKKISAEVINLRFLTPIDKTAIITSIYKTKKVVTLEDAYLEGGVATKIKDLLLQMPPVKSLFLGYPNEFIKHGSNEELEKQYGLNTFSIAKKIIKIIEKDRKKAS